MRVDNPEHGDHDHGFGLGAHQPELHDVSADQHAGTESHGLFEHIGETTAALGGHVEIGQLDHDFGHDGHHEGLDGLHDNVHASLGLGFGGDEHHSLHEGLHDSSLHETHDVSHDHGALHDLGAHGVGHDVAHDPHDPHHLDIGLHG